MVDGRIIKGVGGLYTITTENATYKCKPRGIFRLDNTIPLIGDNVKISVQDEKNKQGTIEEIKQRTNEMIRPRVSNIDLAVLVFTLKNPPINPELIDRFIVLAEHIELDVLICINKIDLVAQNKVDILKNNYKTIGYDFVGITTFEQSSKQKLEKYLKNKVSVFAGPSGVGKSSIVNLFAINNQMETGDISKKSKRGKHTTRHAELIKIKENTFLVDSPGFTSVSISHLEKEKLQFYFREFMPLIGKCKFNNCLHINEPDCNIKNEIGKSISEARYKRYVNFYNEIDKGRK